MRLKPEETKKLAQHAANLLQTNKDLKLKSTRAEINAVIENTILAHFNQEREIEEQAMKLYTERAQSIGSHERGKAIFMVKKMLAKEKKFILSGGAEGRFTQDKILHIAHLVADKLFNDDMLDFPHEDDNIKFFKRVFVEYFGKEDAIDQKVRTKIASQRNAPLEGSKDWDVLFKKYSEEELRRLGHS